jgi:hypothetical protein
MTMCYVCSYVTVGPEQATPASPTMSTTIPISALLLPPSPSTSIQSSVSFWTPTITSAYARLRGPSLLYIGVTPPFNTTSRRASFAAAEKLLTALYALIYGLSAIHDAADVDVRIVFLSEEDAVFGPVMSVEQLADLQEWDQLLCPRNDVGYLLQGQFLASTSSPGVRVYYVDAPTKAEDGEGGESAIREVNGEEHTVVAGGYAVLVGRTPLTSSSRGHV